MWNELDKPWQVAFELAWQAYKNGTIPIGCIIVNKEDAIISTGRNRIFDLQSKNPLAGTNMAHAEMTALLGLNEREHSEIRSYKLYTTMEPCPMCFGTMVMMNIRNIYYGARDNFGGATALNDKLRYIESKKINIQKGKKFLEIFQLVMQTAYECERKHPEINNLLNRFSETDEFAVIYGKKLYSEGYFKVALKEEKSIGNIFDEVLEGYSLYKNKI